MKSLSGLCVVGSLILVSSVSGCAANTEESEADSASSEQALQSRGTCSVKKVGHFAGADVVDGTNEFTSWVGPGFETRDGHQASRARYMIISLSGHVLVPPTTGYYDSNSISGSIHLRAASGGSRPVVFKVASPGNYTFYFPEWQGTPATEAGGALPDDKYTLELSSSLCGVPFTYNQKLHFGDVNGDGYTDNTDFVAFRAAYGTSGHPAFDFNWNTKIDDKDFAAFRARFGY